MKWKVEVIMLNIFQTVKIDDFNKNVSAGPQGDYLSLKKSLQA